MKKLFDTAEGFYAYDIKGRIVQCLAMILCLALAVLGICFYLGGGFILHFLYWLKTGENISEIK